MSSNGSSSEKEVPSFEEVMDIEEVQNDGARRFMSRRPAWAPFGGNAYGGHVFAQAAWAAAQTVEEGMVVHNTTGYFTLPGFTDRPFIYTVTPISNGRSYSVRNITVHQPSSPSQSSTFTVQDAASPPSGICFTSTVSFKRDETGYAGHVSVTDPTSRYPFLRELKVEDCMDAPDVDAPWFINYNRTHPTPPFRGLSIKKADMACYNAHRPAQHHRQLSFYRPLGLLRQNANLHACAHLFASDRNSLFLISNALGFPNNVKKMGSLSHCVVFHVDSRDLMFPPDEGAGKLGRWWVQEAWTPRSAQGRGVHESWIWSPDGTHVASTWQEGLVRQSEDGGIFERGMKGKL